MRSNKELANGLRRIEQDFRKRGGGNSAGVDSERYSILHEAANRLDRVVEIERGVSKLRSGLLDLGILPSEE